LNLHGVALQIHLSFYQCEMLLPSKDRENLTEIGEKFSGKLRLIKVLQCFNIRYMRNSNFNSIRFLVRFLKKRSYSVRNEFCSVQFVL